MPRKSKDETGERPAELDEYIGSLYSRLKEGLVVPFVGLPVASWQHHPSQAHQNVDAVCRSVDGHTPIRGYLIHNWAFFGLYSFFPHSVVELPSGQWVDPTPRQPNAVDNRNAFIPADLDEGTFFEYEKYSEEKYAGFANGLIYHLPKRE